jgi:hypothetical protein
LYYPAFNAEFAQPRDLKVGSAFVPYMDMGRARLGDILCVQFDRNCVRFEGAFAANF